MTEKRHIGSHNRKVFYGFATSIHISHRGFSLAEPESIFPHPHRQAAAVGIATYQMFNHLLITR